MRDGETEVDSWLAYQLIDKDQFWCAGVRSSWQLESANQASGDRLDGVVCRWIGKGTVYLEDVDLPLAAAAILSVRYEIELERVCPAARWGARQVGEGDDKVLFIGIVWPLTDLKAEGYASVGEISRMECHSG